MGSSCDVPCVFCFFRLEKAYKSSPASNTHNIKVSFPKNAAYAKLQGSGRFLMIPDELIDFFIKLHTIRVLKCDYFLLFVLQSLNEINNHVFGQLMVNVIERFICLK